MKRCSKCGQIKPLDEFGKHRTERDGMRSECKACHAKSARQWYWADPGRAREKSRQYRESHPEQVSEYDQRYRQAHPESARQWYWADPGRAREKSRRWYQANPEKAIASAHTRRAQQAQAPGQFTAEQWAALKDEYCHRCAYCGERSTRLTVDHIVPLDQGGSNDIANIVPACGSCNQSKGSTPLLQWLGRRKAATR